MKKKSTAILAIGAMLASATALAVPVEWTDWENITFTSALGTMGGIGVEVSSRGNMDGPSQTECGSNWWTEPDASDPAYTGGTVDNAPGNCEQIGLNNPNTITVTFSAAVDNLYMALLSVGQPSYTVTYDFDQAFTIDSEGRGFWGNDSTDGVPGADDTLAMREFHGVLLFTGPVTSLTFSTSPNEYWHAFTFGMGPSEVPEPGTLLLLGAGLLGLVASRRRTIR